MTNWKTILKYDPIGPLIQSNNEAIAFFAKRDLQKKENLIPTSLWNLPWVTKIVAKQNSDGSWKYPGANKLVRSQENYDQMETFRNLGYLVEMAGFNKSCPEIRKAANFLFKFQTDSGDIRGILGNQYSPYYTAAMMELLIKAGYSHDRRITKAFKWLESIRQDDGGWAIPFRTRGEKLEIISSRRKPVEPDRSKPFSHLVTGVVLRAYAAHEDFRDTTIAREAGTLLLSHLFQRDNYPDRRGTQYWLGFTFPFWFTDLISAMDSLSLLGFSKNEPKIKKAIGWFATHQQKYGLWNLKVLKNLEYNSNEWLSLAICRILQRLYS